MRISLGVSAALLVTVATSGCGKDDAADSSDDRGQLESSSGSGESSSSGGAASSSSSGGKTSSSSSSSGAGESCTATFVWLQKDAYKETGGRTTELWPPHTTTTLEVTCDGESVATAFMANHGSEPGAKDADGNDFLAEQRRLDVPGSRADLLALVATYQGCECEPASFLSMNSLDQSLVADLLENFTDLVDQNVTCEDGAEAQLVTALQAQDFETALGIVPTCTWPGPDGNPAQTLNEALEAVIAATQSTLADYHVCNNDAKLQADLVTGFAGGAPLAACDRASALCHGPLWFYNPNE